jgi:hypothetical protein
MANKVQRDVWLDGKVVELARTKGMGNCMDSMMIMMMMLVVGSRS